MTGEIVKKFEQKGFGFIRGNKTETFFHVSGCVTRFEDLNVGDQVTYETKPSDKGPRAVKVTLVT